jgi:hypothetical protein
MERFCNGTHKSLDALQGCIDVLKLNLGTSHHCLEQKLDELRQNCEAKKGRIAEARIQLESWRTKREVCANDDGISSGDAQLLAARAQKAEECVANAFLLAHASLDDVERMTLEAIAARIDAETATVG